MSERERITLQAEELVRRLIEKNSGQKADKETVRTVAEKVSRAVPAYWQEKHV